MEAKLKSISKQIPWSLLTKAAIFGALWLSAPRWVFLAFALYLYARPFFQAVEMSGSFLLLLVVSLAMPPSALAAVFLGAAFFLLLGVKELYFIRRVLAHEFLLFMLLYLSASHFFAAIEAWERMAAFGALFAMGALFFFLAKQFVNMGGFTPAFRTKIAMVAFLSLLLVEFGIALLFLPLAAFHQGALLFLGSALLIEFLRMFLEGRFEKERVLRLSGVFLGVVAIVFWATEWGF